MEVFKYKDNYIGNEFIDEEDIFLDIETTGVRPYADYAWCIGYSFLRDRDIITKQIFIESVKDELASLALLHQELSYFKRIITFNGEVFDLNFLKNRARSYKMELVFPEKSYDIYKIFRHNKKFLMMDKIDLKSIESLLDIYRDDPLSGKETIKLYLDAISSNSDDKKRELLNHNYYDVKNLPILMEALKYIKSARSYHIKDNSLFCKNFYCKNDELIIVLDGNKYNIDFYDEFTKVFSNDDELTLSFQTKKTLLEGRECRYFLHNNRVVETTKNGLLYPILKDEVIKKLNIIISEHYR